jgi:outer membrane protein assembly factor BamD
MSAEKIYNQGKSSAKKERYAMAVKDFEALEARYPYGDYTCKAQLALIHAYYKKDEAASATAAADRFIRMYPNHKDIDYVYYLKGLINYDENYSTAYRYFPIERSLRDPTLARESFDNFKTLLQRFPNSKYASDAKQRMIHLRNQLANHELYIAKHYLNKKAYIAAANRAGYIVNQFDQTEATPHALAIMVKAYQALGMEKLANDALVILNKNFPQYSVENLIKKIS